MVPNNAPFFLNFADTTVNQVCLLYLIRMKSLKVVDRGKQIKFVSRCERQLANNIKNRLSTLS